MKYIIGLIIGIILLACQPSSNIKIKERGKYITTVSTGKNIIEVENSLLEYTIDFLKEAEEYGYEIDKVAENFIGIYTDVLPSDKLGLTIFRDSSSEKNYSIITKSILDLEAVKRMCVYHELAHVFIKREHCHRKCNEIMSEYHDTHNYYNDFNEQKMILFKQLDHDFSVYL